MQTMAGGLDSHHSPLSLLAGPPSPKQDHQRPNVVVHELSDGKRHPIQCFGRVGIERKPISDSEAGEEDIRKETIRDIHT